MRSTQPKLIAGCLALALVAPTALAQGTGVSPTRPIPPQTNQTPGLEAPAEKRSYEAVNRATTIHSDDLIGAKVRNERDETIGTIAALLISTDARVEGVVLDVGGFLGIGARQVVVPMARLSMNGADVRLQEGNRDSLRSLPPYQRSRDRR
ncbi:MAG: PRC-barrel domain-containing protein [Reyranellaceae bacterium]